MPFQPHEIQTDNLGAVADSHAERRDIPGHGRSAADKGMGANPAELMNGG